MKVGILGLDGQNERAGGSLSVAIALLFVIGDGRSGEGTAPCGRASRQGDTDGRSGDSARAYGDRRTGQSRHRGRAAHMEGSRLLRVLIRVSRLGLGTGRRRSPGHAPRRDREIRAVEAEKAESADRVLHLVGGRETAGDTM